MHSVSGTNENTARDVDRFEIAWDNLTVKISPSETRLDKIWRGLRKLPNLSSSDIIRKNFGHANSGDMVAIMGPNGSGKTTLLAALAKRIELISGAVKINGRDISPGTMSELSGYMPHREILPPFLTSLECLLFTCALKVENSSVARKSLSENLLDKFGLRSQSDTAVSKLSGGERKRLSLANEMITRPKILFLDEPTTGLDIFTAVNVMLHVKLITLDGTIVFCTMHQPGMAIYNLFSHVTFMANGRTAYFGTTGNATEFFNSLGYHCPTGFDESEYYVAILSGKNFNGRQQHTNNERIDRTSGICDSFARSQFFDNPGRSSENILLDLHESYHPRKRRKWIIQVWWILWRNLVQDRRSIFTGWISWMSYMLSISIVGLFYASADKSGQDGAQTVTGALYTMMAEVIFTIAYSTAYEIPEGILLYTRESSLYCPSAYFVGTIVGLVPKVSFRALIFAIVMFFLLNANVQYSAFFLFCAYTVLAGLCATAYGIMISSWTGNTEFATIIMVPLDLLFLLTSGVYYNLRTFPSYLKWFKYISMFYYATEAAEVIHWSRIDKIECLPELPCLATGQELLEDYGYEKSHLPLDMIGLVLLTVVMSYMGYLGVRKRRGMKFMY